MLSDMVKLFGVLVGGAGLSFFLEPKIFKRFVSFWDTDDKLKAHAIIRITVGVILLLAARYCQRAWFIYTFGGLAFFAGAAQIFFGPEMMKRILKALSGIDLKAIRLIGLGVFCLGVFIVLSV